MDTSQGEPSVYPAAIAVPILAGLAVLLDIPPFYWHLRHRNIAASSLILWLILLNLCNVVNALIWPNDNIGQWWHGKILCDIEARLFVGATVGITGALACIMQGLARVMDTKRIVLVPSRAQRWRQYVLDLLFCWGCPVYLMLAYYIMQPARYSIYGISGCNWVIDNSLPSVFLVFIWPPIFSLIDAYYSGLVIYRLHRHRREFSCLLQAADTTRSRFLRLFLMTLVLIFGTLPVQFYLFASNLSTPRIPYSWAEIHKDWNLVEMVPTRGTATIDTWVRIVCGYLVFAFFGMGTEAAGMYRAWLTKLGLTRLWPGLDSRHSSFLGASPLSSRGSLGSKVGKVFGRKSSQTATTTTSSSITWGPANLRAPDLSPTASSKRSLLSFLSFRAKPQGLLLPTTEPSSAHVTLPSIRRSSTFSDVDLTVLRSAHSSTATAEEAPAKEVAVRDKGESRMPAAVGYKKGSEVVTVGEAK